MGHNYDVWKGGHSKWGPNSGPVVRASTRRLPPASSTTSNVDAIGFSYPSAACGGDRPRCDRLATMLARPRLISVGPSNPAVLAGTRRADSAGSARNDYQQFCELRVQIAYASPFCSAFPLGGKGLGCVANHCRSVGRIEPRNPAVHAASRPHRDSITRPDTARLRRGHPVVRWPLSRSQPVSCLGARADGVPVLQVCRKSVPRDRDRDERIRRGMRVVADCHLFRVLILRGGRRRA
jgi:hypothetical protein